MTTAATPLEQAPFAAEVASRLQSLNVSQNFLAEYAGLSQGELSKILTGVRPQNSDRINQIRAALHELEELHAVLPVAAFEDAKTIRDIIQNPARHFSNLFAVLSATQKNDLQLDFQWVQQEWLEFLEASGHAQSNAAGI